MQEKITPKLATVRPRIISPNTGDALVLEDFARTLATQQGQRLELVGGRGSGKTTALAHLAALPDADQFYLIDNLESESVPSVPAEKLLIYTRSPQRGATADEFQKQLAEWTKDDLIEYLLAGFPEQCASVVARFQEQSGLEKLSGNPQLICLVVAELAKDETIELQQALIQALHRCVDTPELRKQAGECAVQNIVTNVKGQGLESAEPGPFSERPVLSRVLAQHCAQLHFAVDHVVPQLKKKPQKYALLPRDFIEELADAATRDRDLLEALKSVFDKRTKTNKAVAGSILHRADPLWRPRCRSRLELKQGYFEYAKWHGINLEHALLRSADLSHADLSNAQLAEVNLKDASLRYANLHNACMIKSVGDGAEFAHANLQNAQLAGGRFCEADFSSADLRRVSASQARFLDADLRSANLAGGHFESASFSGADLSNANLEGANFRNATMVEVKLQDTKLDAADFSKAAMRCNLEGATIREGIFEGAGLRRSLFTGSYMPNVNMRKARLIGAGLADIDWEGADLRDADLSRCSFHLGSSRSGLVGSPYASHGTRTGFYSDEYDTNAYKTPEEVRKANLCGANLAGAKVTKTDFYLVDLRGALYDKQQEAHFRSCRAILDDWTGE